MLLQLIGNPVLNSNISVYYLGWERTSTSSSSGVCIHHPQRAQKKISIIDTLINSYPFVYQWRYDNYSPQDTHWKVQFTNGTVENVSSGSPLLNQNKCVIG